MDHDDDTAPFEVPARRLKIPSSVSEQARQVLARGRTPAGSSPPLDDHEAWRRHIATANSQIAAMFAGWNDGSETSRIEALRVFDIRPAGLDPASRPVVLDSHGGALVFCAGDICRAMCAGLAARLGLRVWGLDYRMPPDDPYPAALDDAMVAYRALLEQRRPGEIIFSGQSAGGNLAAAAILRARDEGLPLPAAAILLTPEVDLTESGDSFQTNLGVDQVLTGNLMPANLLYADGHDLEDPYLSPLFGDFSKGFPPTFLATGTRDLFLSNTVRMHWALLEAGVRADLHVLEAASHTGFPMAPEGLALDRQLRRFVSDVLKPNKPL